MDEILLEKYGPVIENYDIKPQYLQEHGNVLKIYSGQQTFSLKKTTKARFSRALQSIETLHRKSYRKFVPFYRTVNGQLMVEHQNSVYYLMPWIPIEHHVGVSCQDVMTEAARLHLHTISYKKISENQFLSLYHQLKTEWEKRQHDFHTFLEACESKLYMSPYELFYCLHYHEILRLEGLAVERLDKWYLLMEEERDIREVLCHGYLSPDHLLKVTDRSYFINFERSFYGSPVYELTAFFRTALYENTSCAQEAIEWLQVYERHLRLLDKERELLKFHLLQANSVHCSIRAYVSNHHIDEIEHVKRLQRAIQQMRACDYFVNQMVHTEWTEEERPTFE
jgi:spore coat protein YsxE